MGCRSCCAALGGVGALLTAAWWAEAISPQAIALVIAIATAAYLYAYRRFVYVVIVKLPRDCRFVYRFALVLYKVRRFAARNATVASIFLERAARDPGHPCFYFEDQVWTYKDVAELSNRVARVFQEAGLTRGDVAALLMENRPEFVCMWLGLSQLGVVTALVNTNLKLQTLLHSVTVAEPKIFIFSSQLAPAVASVADQLAPSIELYEWGGGDVTPLTSRRCKKLKALLDAADNTPPFVSNPPGYKDRLMYIYTSGTTGLPKAAIVLQSRYLLATTGTRYALDLRDDDVIYNPLPLYHTAGGVLGTGSALINGIPIVIKTKFSASAYFPDCIKYKCTVAQYIGEMCRYLLAVPPKPEDRGHYIRLMFGNGMRSGIWRQFVDRFQVDGIRELYGATEGNVNIVNIDNTVGAVGAIPVLLMWSNFRVGIVRCDRDTGEPIRDDRGLCTRCDVDEPGMFVGVISAADASSAYHGYTDEAASSKKIWRNVFQKGDTVFVSGDILVMDKYGYLYFKDRTGDTFRWKGENVATAEVEAVVSNAVGLRDAVVYGVEVPGQEGRAGMVAIVDPDNAVSMTSLAASLDQLLPPYARPLFVRTLKKVDLTGTFKMKKVELQKDGFNPSLVIDDLYFRKGHTYVALTLQLFQDIEAGKERV